MKIESIVHFKFTISACILNKFCEKGTMNIVFKFERKPEIKVYCSAEITHSVCTKVLQNREFVFHTQDPN